MKIHAVAQLQSPSSPRSRGIAYRSGAFGLLFAGMAFTYALATSGSGDTTLSLTAGSRAIGTTCPRLQTQFVTDSDLGLVLAGSTFKRRLLVRYGIPPHTFQILIKPTTGFNIDSQGIVSGKAVDGVDTFLEGVLDFSSKKAPLLAATRNFFITGITPDTSSGLPVFVNGPVLSKGVTGQVYEFPLQVVGGTPPYTFDVLDDVSQQAVPQGLVVGSDGDITGTPIIGDATSTFQVTATDSTGIAVKQTVSITIVQGSIQSDLIASSGTFFLRFGRDGSQDAFHLSLIINKAELSRFGIRKQSDLVGLPFAMKIGGVLFPQTLNGGTTSTTPGTGNIFDQKGSIKVPAPFVFGTTTTTPKNAPRYKISLNPANGALNVSFSGASLITGLNANFRTFHNNIPVEVTIGSASVAQLISTSVATSSATGTGTTATPANVVFDKSAVVKFNFRRNATSGKGTTNKSDITSPTGQFIITKVHGTETLGSGNFDFVQMSFGGFLRLPGGKPVAPNAGDVVSVIVGGSDNNCIGSFPASSFIQSGSILTFTNSDASIPLQTITIDNKKGTILINTHKVEAFRLFSEDILESGVPHILPVIVTFSSPDGKNVTFDAISTVGIFRHGTRLQNR